MEVLFPFKFIYALLEGKQQAIRTSVGKLQEVESNKNGYDLIKRIPSPFEDAVGHHIDIRRNWEPQYNVKSVVIKYIENKCSVLVFSETWGINITKLFIWKNKQLNKTFQ